MQFIKNERKVDTEVDRKYEQRRIDKIIVSEKRFQIWYKLIKDNLCQKQVADKLHISRQAVHKHVDALETLGVIKPIDDNANPKFYKSTTIIPITKWSNGKVDNAVLSKNAKKPKRRVGKTCKTVRDKKSGKFKGKKRSKSEDHYRDYDILISKNGKRVHLLRMHSIAYSCTVLSDSSVTIPWKKVGSPKGMDQYVYRHKFTNSKVEIDDLKDICVTFMRKSTKNTDEIIIYMPEKYLLEHELVAAKSILEQYVWDARKWFQRKFQIHIGMPIMYRNMEIAREIDDPAIKNYVEEHGMMKVRTKHGYGVVDQSKKGFPEREFSSIELVEADLRMPDRVLSLEEQMAFLIEQQRKTMEMINEMSKIQHQFHSDMQEFIGFRMSVEKKLEDDSKNMFS